MTKDQSELEIENEQFDKDWVTRAKISSEDLRFIKARLRNLTDSQKSVDIGLIGNNYFQEDSDWGFKLQRYLEVESEASETGLNPKTAAKLAVSRMNVEQKLVTSIELGKSEYTICSLK